MASGRLRNTKTEIRGERVNWMGIKWLRFMKTEPDTFYYKYRMFEDFKILKIRGTSRRKLSKRISFDDILPSRYSARIPISDKKKKDLLDLCRSGVVPRDCHSYYENLPSNKSVPDRLPESDVEDENDTDDD